MSTGRLCCSSFPHSETPACLISKSVFGILGFSTELELSNFRDIYEAEDNRNYKEEKECLFLGEVRWTTLKISIGISGH